MQQAFSMDLTPLVDDFLGHCAPGEVVVARFANSGGEAESTLNPPAYFSLNCSLEAGFASCLNSICPMCGDMCDSW
jgi:hypothetical protein